MDEQQIRHLVSDVKSGRLSRRAFTRTMIGFGLTAPFAAQLLAGAGVAHAQPRPAATFTPTRMGTQMAKIVIHLCVTHQRAIRASMPARLRAGV